MANLAEIKRGLPTITNTMKLIAKDFNSLVEKKGLNKLYADIDLEVSQKIDFCKDLKHIAEAQKKELEQVLTDLRNQTLAYMEKNGIEKTEGDGLKSITYYPESEKVVKKVDRQIKKGRSYVSLSTLSKDDLIDMLIEKGVKVKDVAIESKKVQKATIRVVR